jgi:hypothetical protein
MHPLPSDRTPVRVPPTKRQTTNVRARSWGEHGLVRKCGAHLEEAPGKQHIRADRSRLNLRLGSGFFGSRLLDQRRFRRRWRPGRGRSLGGCGSGACISGCAAPLRGMGCLPFALSERAGAGAGSIVGDILDAILDDGAPSYNWVPEAVVRRRQCDSNLNIRQARLPARQPSPGRSWNVTRLAGRAKGLSPRVDGMMVHGITVDPVNPRARAVQLQG